MPSYNWVVLVSPASYQRKPVALFFIPAVHHTHPTVPLQPTLGSYSGREWKANWVLIWSATTTEPVTTRLPLTPSWVFEEDIYKALVWQRHEAWLFHLLDLSCVSRQEAGGANRVTGWRLIRPAWCKKKTQLTARGTLGELTAARV